LDIQANVEEATKTLSELAKWDSLDQVRRGSKTGVVVVVVVVVVVRCLGVVLAAW